MRTRGFDLGADAIVMDAIGAAGAFTPANLKQANAQSATLQQLSALHDYRQRRLSANGSGTAKFEWLVLIVGAACIVGFCWLFGLENQKVHLLMTSAVTVIVTTTLVLLFELQSPFQSDLRIRPTTGTASLPTSSSCRTACRAGCGCEPGAERAQLQDVPSSNNRR